MAISGRGVQLAMPGAAIEHTRGRLAEPHDRSRQTREVDELGEVVWATGYRLDFGWLDLPVLDEWGYPHHTRGVTTHPGLYVVGLPWLHALPSALLSGVGADAAHIVDHIARHRTG
jgi:hypothetical protein